MNIEEKLEIHDCPLCDGGALLEGYVCWLYGLHKYVQKECYYYCR